MKKRNIYITETDMAKLRRLIKINYGPRRKDNVNLKKLEKELDGATVVPPKDIPDNVITMNSLAIIKDLDSGEEMRCWLVFPEKAGASKNMISILAPIGTAMLGYSIGDTFEWEVPAGKKRFLVVDIIYQPERVGNYEL
ncbi:MAG: Regulator of nucleoside diphosphate kinase [Syntrophorhabdus sp. PtaU1.Bin153]|nr:MAG: Regulator of nucleoside diphosphate kinase [Syntrophorhabdus sp. PtaU1.Bin153]